VIPGWFAGVNKVPFLPNRFSVVAAWAILFAADPVGAHLQNNAQPPSFVPVPMPDFHFSDPALDAAYWRLERDSDRTLAVFRDAVSVARRALKHPAPAPGTPAWFQARAAVEQAILARRPARDAELAIIKFVIRERPRLPPSEAARAVDIWRVNEVSLRGTSDTLVGLLAALASIKIDQFPP
jgi:hypothetical protein